VEAVWTYGAYAVHCILLMLTIIEILMLSIIVIKTVIIKLMKRL
jgi:hypothetical protein